MRPASSPAPSLAPSLAPALVLALLPLPLAAQEVSPCDPVPSAAALIEPWEETTVALAGGAVRLALLEGEEGTRRLLVLTLPPPDPAPAPEGPAPDGPTPQDPAPEEGGEPAPESAPEPAPEDVPEATVESDPTAPPPERTCRIVAEGGLGFADLDLAGLAAEEDAEAGTLVVRMPALHFIPESSELAQETLVLTFGVAGDSLVAAMAP